MAYIRATESEATHIKIDGSEFNETAAVRCQVTIGKIYPLVTINGTKSIDNDNGKRILEFEEELDFTWMKEQLEDKIKEWKEQWNNGDVKFVPELFELVEKEKYEPIKEKIINYFSQMTRDERENVIRELRGKYCLHCGREHEDIRGCQCWNDE